MKNNLHSISPNSKEFYAFVSGKFLPIKKGGKIIPNYAQNTFLFLNLLLKAHSAPKILCFILCFPMQTITERKENIHPTVKYTFFSSIY